MAITIRDLSAEEAIERQRFARAVNSLLERTRCVQYFTAGLGEVTGHDCSPLGDTQSDLRHDGHAEATTNRYRQPSRHSSSNSKWSNLRVAAFSLTTRTTRSGMPSLTLTMTSSVTSTSESTRPARCCKTSSPT